MIPERTQSRLLAAILAIGIAFLLLQAIQTWKSLQADSSQFGRLTALTRGAICSVLLVNGQMYYGNLVESGNGFIRLDDVYYVRTVANKPDTGASTSYNVLVNRQRTDWHGPEWMAIPWSKVMMVEKVGANSQVAKLIAQDRKAHGG